LKHFLIGSFNEEEKINMRTSFVPKLRSALAFMALVHCGPGERYLVTQAMRQPRQNVLLEADDTPPLEVGNCQVPVLAPIASTVATAIASQPVTQTTSTPPITPDAGTVVATAANSLFAALHITPTVVNNMDSDLTNLWERRNGRNGTPFDCAFTGQNISFADGIMALTLNRAGSSVRSGEYRTRTNFSYGYYEVRMQPTQGQGLMAGSFFTYTGTYGRPNHHEIDIKALGKDCSIQLNHYGAGQGNHERVLSPQELGFNPCQGFNNYGFAWRPTSITYYINGAVVHTVSNQIPSGPGQIMLNLWNGNSSADGWLGHFNYSGPVTARYDSVRFAPIGN
jgi:beta-glucanase (GH16 family)